MGRCPKCWRESSRLASAWTGGAKTSYTGLGDQKAVEVRTILKKG